MEKCTVLSGQRDFVRGVETDLHPTVGYLEAFYEARQKAEAANGVEGVGYMAVGTAEDKTPVSHFRANPGEKRTSTPRTGHYTPPNCRCRRKRRQVCPRKLAAAAAVPDRWERVRNRAGPVGTRTFVVPPEVGLPLRRSKLW